MGVAGHACPGCGAGVWWMVNDETGKRAPVSTEHHEFGNVVMLEHGKYHVLTKTAMEALAGSVQLIPDPELVAELELVENRPRTVLHWADCQEPKGYERRDSVRHGR